MLKNGDLGNRILGEVLTFYFVLKDRDTPIYVKIFAFLGLCYALSPIDIIPDFIPVLGYLDDVLIIPFFYFLIKKLTPSSILEKAKKDRAIIQDTRIYKIFGVVFSLVFWILLLLILFFAFLKGLRILKILK